MLQYSRKPGSHTWSRGKGADADGSRLTATSIFAAVDFPPSSLQLEAEISAGKHTPSIEGRPLITLSKLRTADELPPGLQQKIHTVATNERLMNDPHSRTLTLGTLKEFSSVWWVDGNELNLWHCPLDPEKPDLLRNSPNCFTITTVKPICAVAFTDLKLSHELAALIPELDRQWGHCRYLMQQVVALHETGNGDEFVAPTLAVGSYEKNSKQASSVYRFVCACVITEDKIQKFALIGNAYQGCKDFVPLPETVTSIDGTRVTALAGHWPSERFILADKSGHVYEYLTAEIQEAWVGLDHQLFPQQQSWRTLEFLKNLASFAMPFKAPLAGSAVNIVNRSAQVRKLFDLNTIRNKISSSIFSRSSPMGSSTHFVRIVMGEDDGHAYLIGDDCDIHLAVIPPPSLRSQIVEGPSRCGAKSMEEIEKILIQICELPIVVLPEPVLKFDALIQWLVASDIDHESGNLSSGARGTSTASGLRNLLFGQGSRSSGTMELIRKHTKIVSLHPCEHDQLECVLADGTRAIMVLSQPRPTSGKGLAPVGSGWNSGSVWSITKSSYSIKTNPAAYIHGALTRRVDYRLWNSLSEIQKTPLKAPLRPDLSSYEKVGLLVTAIHSAFSDMSPLGQLMKYGKLPESPEGYMRVLDSYRSRRGNYTLLRVAYRGEQATLAVGSMIPLVSPRDESIAHQTIQWLSLDNPVGVNPADGSEQRIPEIPQDTVEAPSNDRWISKILLDMDVPLNSKHTTLECGTQPPLSEQLFAPLERMRFAAIFHSTLSRADYDSPGDARMTFLANLLATGEALSAKDLLTAYQILDTTAVMSVTTDGLYIQQRPSTRLIIHKALDISRKFIHALFGEVTSIARVIPFQVYRYSETSFDAAVAALQQQTSLPLPAISLWSRVTLSRHLLTAATLRVAPETAMLTSMLRLDASLDELWIFLLQHMMRKIRAEDSGGPQTVREPRLSLASNSQLSLQSTRLAWRASLQSWSHRPRAYTTAGIGGHRPHTVVAAYEALIVLPLLAKLCPKQQTRTQQNVFMHPNQGDGGESTRMNSLKRTIVRSLQPFSTCTLFALETVFPPKLGDSLRLIRASLTMSANNGSPLPVGQTTGESGPPPPAPLDPGAAHPSGGTGGSDAKRRKKDVGANSLSKITTTFIPNLRFRYSVEDMERGRQILSSLRSTIDDFESFGLKNISGDMRPRLGIDDPTKVVEIRNFMQIGEQLFAFLKLLAQAIESLPKPGTSQVHRASTSSDLIIIDQHIFDQLANLSFAEMLGMLYARDPLLDTWLKSSNPVATPLCSLISPTALLKECNLLFPDYSLAWAAAIEGLQILVDEIDSHDLARRVVLVERVQREEERLQRQKQTAALDPVKIAQRKRRCLAPRSDIFSEPTASNRQVALEYLWNEWTQQRPAGARDMLTSLPLPPLIQCPVDELSERPQEDTEEAEVSLNLCFDPRVATDVDESDATKNLAFEIAGHCIKALASAISLVRGNDSSDTMTHKIMEGLLELLFRIHSYDLMALTLAVWIELNQKPVIGQNLMERIRPTTAAPGGAWSGGMSVASLVPPSVQAVIRNYLNRMASLIDLTDGWLGWDVCDQLIMQFTCRPIPSLAQQLRLHHSVIVEAGSGVGPSLDAFAASFDAARAQTEVAIAHTTFFWMVSASGQVSINFPRTLNSLNTPHLRSWLETVAFDGPGATAAFEDPGNQIVAVADYFLKSGDYQKAIEQFGRVIDDHPRWLTFPIDKRTLHLQCQQKGSMNRRSEIILLDIPKSSLSAFRNVTAPHLVADWRALLSERWLGNYLKDDIKLVRDFFLTLYQIGTLPIHVRLQLAWKAKLAVLSNLASRALPLPTLTYGDTPTGAATWTARSTRFAQPGTASRMMPSVIRQGDFTDAMSVLPARTAFASPINSSGVVENPASVLRMSPGYVSARMTSRQYPTDPSLTPPPRPVNPLAGLSLQGPFSTANHVPPTPLAGLATQQQIPQFGLQLHQPTTPQDNAMLDKFDVAQNRLGFQRQLLNDLLEFCATCVTGDSELGCLMEDVASGFGRAEPTDGPGGDWIEKTGTGKRDVLLANIFNLGLILIHTSVPSIQSLFSSVLDFITSLGGQMAFNGSILIELLSVLEPNANFSGQLQQVLPSSAQQVFTQHPKFPQEPLVCILSAVSAVQARRLLIQKFGNLGFVEDLGLRVYNAYASCSLRGRSSAAVGILPMAFYLAVDRSLRSCFGGSGTISTRLEDKLGSHFTSTTSAHLEKLRLVNVFSTTQTSGFGSSIMEFSKILPVPSFEAQPIGSVSAFASDAALRVFMWDLIGLSRDYETAGRLNHPALIARDPVRASKTIRPVIRWLTDAIEYGHYTIAEELGFVSENTRSNKRGICEVAVKTMAAWLKESIPLHASIEPICLAELIHAVCLLHEDLTKVVGWIARLCLPLLEENFMYLSSGRLRSADLAQQEAAQALFTSDLQAYVEASDQLKFGGGERTAESEEKVLNLCQKVLADPVCGSCWMNGPFDELMHMLSNDSERDEGIGSSEFRDMLDTASRVQGSMPGLRRVVEPSAERLEAWLVICELCQYGLTYGQESWQEAGALMKDALGSTSCEGDRTLIRWCIRRVTVIHQKAQELRSNLEDYKALLTNAKNRLQPKNI